MKNNSADLYNPEFEANFIGACMVNPQVLVDSILSTDDFSNVAHQLIYKAIATVYEDSGTVDPVLVADYLKKTGDLNRAGGVNAIYDMQAVIVETKSVGEYAKEIRRLSMKRRICEIAHQAISKATDLSSDPGVVAAEIENRLASLEFEQQRLESYTAFELSKMQVEPVKWFIPGILPSGLTILAGPPKIGKSFFCWNIALAIATGGTAFSSIDIQQSHNVSYLSLEDAPALLKERLALLSDVKPSNLHIVNDMQGKKLDAVGLKTVGQHLDETASDLLIVDTWMHVVPDLNIKGTAYDIDYNALIPIQKFAHRRNMGIILVTHTRKAADIDNVFNQIQGFVGMQAACDTLMMLSNGSGSKTLHLSGKRVENEHLAFTTSGGLWKLEGSADEFSKSELRKEIIGYLKEVGDKGLSAGDLSDLMDKPDENIRQILRRMLRSGEIAQPKKRGNYFHINVSHILN